MEDFLHFLLLKNSIFLLEKNFHFCKVPFLFISLLSHIQIFLQNRLALLFHEKLLFSNQCLQNYFTLQFINTLKNLDNNGMNKICYILR